MPELDASWLLWLKDHGAGYVVAAAWIWTLLRDRMALQRRSEKLSDTLCQALESASVERAKLSDEYRSGHDWIVHTILAQFSELAVRRERSAPVTPVPPKPSTPKPPTKIAASEPIPPPLPNAPKRRER